MSEPRKSPEEEEVLGVLQRAHFAESLDAARELQHVPVEVLENIATNNPSLANTLYDVILRRDTGEEEAPVENKRPLRNIHEKLSTPQTPYEKWRGTIHQFTTLDLETARKVGALFREKYTTANKEDTLCIVQRLEHICESPGFTPQERILSLSLLNTAVNSSAVFPQHALSLCALLRRRKHPFAESTLFSYLERMPGEAGEDLVVQAVKERKEGYSWMLRVFLGAHPLRQHSTLQKIKQDIRVLLQKENRESGLDLLTSLYIHSADDLEESMFADLDEDPGVLIEQCKERLWS